MSTRPLTIDKGKTYNKESLLVILNNLKTNKNTKGDITSANNIQQLIDEINSGKRDAAEVKLKSRIKIKKFNGQKTAGKLPVEEQEFITET